MNGYVFDVAYTNSAAANGFLFRTGSSNRMIINESGNVGIGISDPESKLHIESDGIGFQITPVSSNSNVSQSIIAFNANNDAPTSDVDATLNLVGAQSGFFNHKRVSLKALGTTGGSREGILVIEAREQSSGNNIEVARFQGDGNVGIGTTNPSRLLHVNGSTMDVVSAFESTDSGTQIVLTDNSGSLRLGTLSNGGFALSVGGDASSTTGANVAEAMRVNSAGNVGIGTTTPGNELEVNGTIRSQEVIVEATGWPDYVFHPQYELRPLAEIEDYIKANGHLPEIPSAQEVEEEGQHLGEMQQLLLKKIEELVLHTISQQKLIIQLQEEKKKNDAQEEVIKDLLKRIEKLEKEN